MYVHTSDYTYIYMNNYKKNILNQKNYLSINKYFFAKAQQNFSIQNYIMSFGRKER